MRNYVSRTVGNEVNPIYQPRDYEKPFNQALPSYQYHEKASVKTITILYSASDSIPEKPVQISVGQKYGNFVVSRIFDYSEPDYESYIINFTGEAVVSGSYFFEDMPGADCFSVDTKDQSQLPHGLPYVDTASLCLNGDKANLEKLKKTVHPTIRITDFGIYVTGKDGSPIRAKLEEVF